MEATLVIDPCTLSSASAWCTFGAYKALLTCYLAEICLPREATQIEASPQPNRWSWFSHPDYQGPRLRYFSDKAVVVHLRIGSLQELRRFFPLFIGLFHFCLGRLHRTGSTEVTIPRDVLQILLKLRGKNWKPEAARRLELFRGLVISTDGDTFIWRVRALYWSGSDITLEVSPLCHYSGRGSQSFEPLWGAPIGNSDSAGFPLLYEVADESRLELLGWKRPRRHGKGFRRVPIFPELELALRGCQVTPRQKLLAAWMVSQLTKNRKDGSLREFSRKDYSALGSGSYVSVAGNFPKIHGFTVGLFMKTGVYESIGHCLKELFALADLLQAKILSRFQNRWELANRWERKSSNETLLFFLPSNFRQHTLERLKSDNRVVWANEGQTGQFKAMRVGLGLTQAGLAQMLGCSPGAVSRYESGQRTIPETRLSLLRNLGIDSRRPG